MWENQRRLSWKFLTWLFSGGENFLINKLSLIKHSRLLLPKLSILKLFQPILSAIGTPSYNIAKKIYSSSGNSDKKSICDKR